MAAASQPLLQFFLIALVTFEIAEEDLLRTGMPLILDFALFKAFETQPPPPQEAIAVDVDVARDFAADSDIALALKGTQQTVMIAANILKFILMASYFFNLSKLRHAVGYVSHAS
jgi:hypothetical protein